MDNSCSLTVYGRNDEDINTAMKQLGAHIKNDWIEKPIRESSIAQLKKSKVLTFHCIMHYELCVLDL